MSKQTYGAVSLSLRNQATNSAPKVKTNRLDFCRYIYHLPFPPGYSKFPGVKIVFLVLFLHRLHFYSVFNFIDRLSYIRGPSNPSNEYSQATAQGFLSTSILLAPLPGLIADKYIRRVKVISICLILSLLGSSLQSLFHTFYELYGFPIPNGGYYFVHVIGVTLLIMGSSGIFALLLPVGIDQMEGASESKLKSYFNWHYWIGNFAYLFAFGRYFIYSPEINDRLGLLASSYLATVSIFLAIVVFKLSLTFNLLQRNNPGGTPLRQIIGVLYSAMVNRREQKRENKYKQIKLFDYATTEHGGKFEYEEVQDVKTFLKILFVIVCMTWYFGVYNLLNTEFPLQGRKISCAEDRFYASLIISCGDGLTIAVILPIFELIRYKFKGLGCRKILYKFQLGVIFGLFAIVSALIVNVALDAQNFQCRRQRDDYETLKILRYLPIVIPQTIFIGLSECFAWIGAMEFVYAQSPHFMKGFTFGIMQSITGIGWFIPNCIYIFLFEVSHCSESCSSCFVHYPKCFTEKTQDFVYYSLYLGLTLVYVGAFWVLAVCYKRRERQKIESWPEM